MGNPSRKAIREMLINLQHGDPRVAGKIKRAIDEAGGRKGVDAALDLANKLMEAHGVEALRSEEEWDNYYGDVVALYVNTGDTYSGTLLYDTDAGKWYVTTMGDWVEWAESKRRPRLKFR